MSSFRKPLRLLLLFVGAAVLLAVVVASTSLYDSRRSRLKWEAHRASKVAEGVEYDISRLAPTAVPDEENFYATPLLMPLFTDEAYRTKLEQRLGAPFDDKKNAPRSRWLHGERFDPQAWLVFLKAGDWPAVFRPYEADLEAISKAAKRPAAVLPVPYKQATGASTDLFKLSGSLATLYSLRAKAALAEDRPEAALADLQTLFHLSRHLGRDPFLVSGLVSVARFSQAMEVYWEGVISGRWSDEQLARIQAELQAFDYLSRFHRMLQGERILYVNQLELLLRERGPKVVSFSDGQVQTRRNLLKTNGWLYENLLRGDRFFDGFLLPQADPAARRFDPAVSKAARAAIQQLKDHPEPEHFFVVLSLEAPCDIASRFAHAQTMADLGIVVAALEQHHRQQGSYPDDLAALTASRLEKLPQNLITGESLRYRRTDDGRFLLYSTGWNGTDDGGVREKDETTGDWVWPQPTDSGPGE